MPWIFADAYPRHPRSVVPQTYNALMGRVCVLPEVLAHKIAAGEIVERPASVVKELVENALDAQASRILVEVEQAGTRRISVRDDGLGMCPEDARLAFEHHATSKISKFDDLSRLTTLGFRGEALPAIASISRLRLRTAERAGEKSPPLGTQVEYEGGALRNVAQISWPAGTDVLVEDLFFNVPARRKFLKTITTEFGHVSRQVMHYALASPGVEFRLLHQGRVALETAAVTTLSERIYQLFGESFLDHLVEIQYKQNGIRVHGFTSLPHEQRSSAASQFLYVNGRRVRDRVLTHAIHLAYRDQIPSGTYPVTLLFVEMDPQQIDVNVHPGKTEIRFLDSSTVHRALYHGIEEALLRRKSGGLARVALDLSGLPSWDRRNSNGRRDKGLLFSSATQPLQLPATPEGRSTPAGDIEVSTHGNGDPHRRNIPETADLSPVPVLLGQFVESFLVAADREGVMLVDQHVAHERILYEKALRSLESSQGCPTQQLLVPLTMELSALQKLVLARILDELNRNGFDVEWFGSQTIVIRGVPAVASDCNGERLIQEILEGLESHDAGSGSVPPFPLARLREKIAISVSCRAAVKINTPLSKEKMQWMLDELLRCQSPYTCPHGRPIVLRFNIEEILRSFKRI